ncbi:MAG: hypothetical protein LBE08_08865 [Bifidobacteriaceae bacterium]|nr:hypothetical protein [Bifidobacteriaceae bacterium]
MRKWLFALAAFAIAATVAGLGLSGVAKALWSDSRSRAGAPVTSHPATIELLDISGSGSGQVIDAASASDMVLSLEFGSSAADEIKQLSDAVRQQGGDGTVVWTKLLQLKGTLQGTVGFGYSVQRPPTTAGTYGEGLVLFPVDQVVDCASEEVAAQWGSLPGQGGNQVDAGQPEAVDPGYAKDKSFSQYYCLATRFVPPKFANEATATAPAADGTSVSDTDSWWGYVYPDPTQEPELTFDFEVSLLFPRNLE